MTNSIRVIVAIITLVIFVKGALAESSGRSRPVLGVILPLTGHAAAAGEAVKHGIVLANESLSHPLEIRFQDNQLDGTRTASIARQFINVDKVDGLIVYASGPSHVVAPLAESARVPMIGLSVDPRVSKDRKWVMIHWASNQKTADMLYKELKLRHISRVAVVTTQVQGLLDMEGYFLSHAKENGIEITSAQQFLPTDLDFRTPVSALKKQAPQAVFLNLYYGQASAFAKQLNLQGVKPQIFSHFVLDDDKEVENAAGTLDGAFFASTATGDGSFNKSYLNRFGKRAIVGGIASYDITLLFARAISAGQGSPVAVRQFLHTIKNFEGKIGVYDALPDNTFDVPAEVRVIRDGLVVAK